MTFMRQLENFFKVSWMLLYYLPTWICSFFTTALRVSNLGHFAPFPRKGDTTLHKSGVMNAEGQLVPEAFVPMLPTTCNRTCCCCRSAALLWLFVTPWTAARQAPLSVGFPRQEHWSGLPFPSPGNFPDPGIEPMSPALAGGFFTTEPPGKPWTWAWYFMPLSNSC